MKALAIRTLYEQLSEEAKAEATAYLEFLVERERRRRQKKLLMTAGKIQELLGNDKGWESEEQMIAELAEFRRQKNNEDTY